MTKQPEPAHASSHAIHLSPEERRALASDTFDTALVDFVAGCADQNARDYEAFADAVSGGRIQTSG